jgi:hypothetical protein
MLPPFRPAGRHGGGGRQQSTGRAALYPTAEGGGELEAARDILREAYAECAQVAVSLTDPELRRVYVGALAANARMLRLAQEWQLGLLP